MFEAHNFETKSARDCPDSASPDTPRVPPRYRPRRSTADRLREALLELAENAGRVLTHEESAWSSITFTGTRHEITLDFNGSEAVTSGAVFVTDRPEHEFRIPGHLVADASVREVDHRFGVEERMIITVVLLLLEES